MHQSLFCPLASVANASLTLLLSLGDSNPVWLPSVIMLHPFVELVKPAAIACPLLLSVTAPWQPPKQWGRVEVLFPSKKHGISGTLPSTFSAQQICRVGRLELLAVS